MNLCACGCGLQVARTWAQGHNRKNIDPRPRFWAKVDKSDDCWIWTGARKAEGYGTFRLGDEMLGAHRVSYEWRYGPIPDGLHLDHLCRNRPCVNPDHLEAVTPRINFLRAPTAAPAVNARKTHCIRGHEFTPENTFPLSGGRRDCRECRVIRYAIRMERVRAARRAA